MRSISSLIRKAAKLVINVCSKAKSGFFLGHRYIDKYQVKQLSKLVGAESQEHAESFEGKITSLIGPGEAISFASGRMSFFALMRALGISVGDEVILCGFTCAVMPNAVLRVGATPVYSDVDRVTFGSCPRSIERCLSSKTKLVVAQHSFGIPCSIDKIAEICRRHGVFLVEDCALAIGSRLGDKFVGTFGDAAIFSSDHSKPINTVIGGVLYSEDYELAARVRLIQKTCPHLSAPKQRALWLQFKAERYLAKSGLYGILQNVTALVVAIRKKAGVATPFLDEDNGVGTLHKRYSYPSKMPEFAARIGLYEIERWESTMGHRRQMLEEYKRQFSRASLEGFIPGVYYDTQRFIVPLRFVCAHPAADQVRSSLAKILAVEETWFMKPIINSTVSLDELFYTYGSCPNSETIGPQMINLPLNSTDTVTNVVDTIVSRADIR